MTPTATAPDRHDLQRKCELVNALIKAKERGDKAYLYLIGHDRDPEQIANVALAIEHIEIALGHLGVEGYV